MTDPTSPEENAAARPHGVASIVMPTIHAVVAPSRAFEALDARPVLAWWIVLWLTLGLIGLSMSTLDVQRQFGRVGAIERLSRNGQNLDREQLQRIVDSVDRFAPATAVAQNLFFVLLVLVMAAVFWGGSTMAGGSTKYPRALGVAAVGAVIHPLLATAYTSLNWILNPPHVRRLQDIGNAVPTLGLDLLFGSSDMSFAWRSVLLRLDLFNLWWVIVVVMGCERLLHLKRGAALTIALTLWVLGTAIGAGLASLA